MIKRKYRHINLKDNEFDMFDEINTILYAGKSEHLEKMLNEREEKLCNKIADLEAKLAECEKRDLKLLYEKNKTIIELEEELKYSKNDYMLLEEQLENANDWNKGLLEEIDQLKQQLAETDKLMQEYLSKCLSLEQQLAEKDAEVQNWKDGTMVVKLGKLEEQLKEKDQAIESLQEINKSLGQTCNNDAKEIDRLREQLAEKEKEETKRMQDFEKGCQEYYKSNQTAIAELEKVRTCFGDYLKGLLWNDTMLVGKVCNMINEIVDQQIKSLKGDADGSTN